MFGQTVIDPTASVEAQAPVANAQSFVAVATKLKLDFAQMISSRWNKEEFIPTQQDIDALVATKQPKALAFAGSLQVGVLHLVLQNKEPYTNKNGVTFSAGQWFAIKG